MKILSKLLIAEEDIISYKIGSPKSKLFNQLIVDLYDTNIRLIPGRLYDTKLSLNSYKDNTLIESGLISFKSYNLLDKLSENLILECTIPIGAKYYIGEHFNKPAYASDSIIVNKIININSNIIIDKLYHVNL